MAERQLFVGALLCDRGEPDCHLIGLDLDKEHELDFSRRRFKELVEAAEQQGEETAKQRTAYVQKISTQFVTIYYTPPKEGDSCPTMEIQWCQNYTKSLDTWSKMKFDLRHPEEPIRNTDKNINELYTEVQKEDTDEKEKIFERKVIDLRGRCLDNQFTTIAQLCSNPKDKYRGVQVIFIAGIFSADVSANKAMRNLYVWKLWETQKKLMEALEEKPKEETVVENNERVMALKKEVDAHKITPPVQALLDTLFSSHRLAPRKIPAERHFSITQVIHTKLTQAGVDGTGAANRLNLAKDFGHFIDIIAYYAKRRQSLAVLRPWLVHFEFRKPWKTPLSDELLDKANSNTDAKTLQQNVSMGNDEEETAKRVSFADEHERKPKRALPGPEVEGICLPPF